MKPRPNTAACCALLLSRTADRDAMTPTAVRFVATPEPPRRRARSLPSAPNTPTGKSTRAKRIIQHCQARLLAGSVSELKADVLVAGHYGSLTSSRRPFLDAVGASIYAISSGPYPYRRIRLPNDAIVTELGSRGQLLRTDRNDQFQLETDEHACEPAPRKIGPDADESPGGCDNILIEISGDGAISARYSDLAD